MKIGDKRIFRTGEIVPQWLERTVNCKARFASDCEVERTSKRDCSYIVRPYPLSLSRAWEKEGCLIEVAIDDPELPVEIIGGGRGVCLLTTEPTLQCP